MIMGNKDNICPRSQERTNILSTSKSSLIWQGRRSWMLSSTHVGWWGQERGFWGNLLPVQTWPFGTEDHIHRKEISLCQSQMLPSFRVPLPVPLIPEWLPKGHHAAFFISECGSRAWDSGRWGISADILGRWGLALLLCLFLFPDPPPLA